MPLVTVTDGVNGQTFSFDTTAQQNVTMAVGQTSRTNAVNALESAYNLASSMATGMNSAGVGASSTPSSSSSTVSGASGSSTVSGASS